MYARVYLLRLTWNTVVFVYASESAGTVVYCTATKTAIENLRMKFEHYRSVSGHNYLLRGIEGSDSGHPAGKGGSALWKNASRGSCKNAIDICAFVERKRAY